MARKLIKKPQGLYTLSLLNTDNKVDMKISSAGIANTKINKAKQDKRTNTLQSNTTTTR